jgi:integrase
MAMARRAALEGHMRTGNLPATWRTIKHPGMHGDGGGLYLQIKNVRSKSWIFRFERGGRVRDMGLGSCATITLVEAREIAREQRKLLLEGLDPIEERNARIAKNLAGTAATVTFDAAVQAYLRQHHAGWTPRHARQWMSTLTTYASPTIGRVPVRDVTTAHVMRVLEPIWRTKTETAARVRGRIEQVLDWAKVSGFRSDENPARWRGHLDNLLAARNKVRTVRHFSALPYGEMPGFVQELRARKGMAALALEFCILTAVRSHDARLCRHEVIDPVNRVWTIKAFSKTHREHKVPLSLQALAVVDRARKLATEIGGNVGRSAYAFPNDVSGDRLSSNAMLRVLARMNRKGMMTAHGARASFRTWAMEASSFPWELAELSLGHKVGTVVERSYMRGSAFKRRISIMQAWSDYLDRPQQPGDKVVQLRSTSA